MKRDRPEIEEELILLRAEAMNAMQTGDSQGLLRAKHRMFALNEILKSREMSQMEKLVTFEEASAFLRTWAGDHESPTKKEFLEPRSQRGRRPEKLDAIIAQMRRDITGGYDLQGAKQEELKSKYNASRDTCERARKAVLSRNVEK